MTCPSLAFSERRSYQDKPGGHRVQLRLAGYQTRKSEVDGTVVQECFSARRDGLVLGELRYCINKRRCDSPKVCMDQVVEMEYWCWARCVSAGILVR